MLLYGKVSVTMAAYDNGASQEMLGLLHADNITHRIMKTTTMHVNGIVF